MDYRFCSEIELVWRKEYLRCRFSHSEIVFRGFCVWLGFVVLLYGCYIYLGISLIYYNSW